MVSRLTAPFRRRICERLFESYHRRRKEAVRYLSDNPPINFYWTVGWEVTYRCNLSCFYCPQNHAGAPDEDFERGLATVIRVQPRVVWINGGEPTLVPELPAAIRRIRAECGNPSMVMSSHFNRPAKVLDQFLPLLDSMFVTLDGTGEDNWRSRGFNGARLLERIAEFVPSYPQIRWTICTVVGKYNLEKLRDFARRVQDRLPGIDHNFWGMNHYNQPESLAGNPENLRRFVEIMESICAEFPTVHYSPPMLEHPEVYGEYSPPVLQRFLLNNDLYSCDRMFFNADVTPSGELVDCRTCNIFVELDSQAERALHAGRPLVLLRVLQLLARFASNGNRYDPACPYVCTTHDPNSLVVRATSEDDPRLHANRQLLGCRFRPEDRSKAAVFIRRHINPRFREEFFDLVGPEAPQVIRLRPPGAPDREESLTPPPASSRAPAVPGG